jgi:hypothetical protein
MSEPVELTKQECLNIASEIVAGFKHHNVPIRTNSDIELFIKETRWLADNLDKSRNSLTKENQRRFINAFLRVEQAKNISNVFRQLHDINIPKHKVKFFNKRLDRINRIGDSHAPDILFELEVAGRLARARVFRNVNIQFEEPDIVIEFPGGRIALSCKRPKSIRRLSERIKEAANQGSKTDLSFLVIIGVREIIIKQPFFKFKTQEEFTKHVNDSLNRLLDMCSNSISYAFEKGAGGVIFCDRFVAFVEEPKLSINWYVRHRYRANQIINDIDCVLTDFINLME